ncbi:acyltransferase family protein [Pontibacter liquoris]|uniref:acyltransferase family protein n=1 Tax=Pontibacter liquoris TaxID=2905677 RepID=UPI001FA78891|nr:heparan-alpha-glucosaminide N-acetyltransferase domain-containing protein [Pontibacter liquoris]
MTNLLTANTAPVTTLSSPRISQRYLSLDVLRGLTIALMVVVNTPGSWANIYAPFAHAAWHGFTPTDLVFPTFLFVVGNAMSFSMRKFETLGNEAFLKKVFKRTFLIFMIGVFLQLFPFVVHTPEGGYAWKNFAEMRIFGVLQRIAICYCIASLVVYYLRFRGAVIFSVVVLLGYWAAMYFFGDAADPYSLEGNAALKFDLLFLAPQNLYHGFGIPFDPEGMFSTFPAVVNVIGGYFAGVFIQKQGNTKSTVTKLLLAGVALLCAGLLWDTQFPINKPLWTSSYVLYSVGWDLLLIATLMLLIEVAGYKKWTYFFEVFGRNPLFIFAMSALVIKTLSFIRVGEISLNSWIYQHGFLTWSEGKNASLLFALAYMLTMWLIGYIMDKKKIYVKV